MRRLAAIGLILLVGAVSRGDAPTSGTLPLGAIFDLSVLSPTPTPIGIGALVTIPDTSQWALPAASPTPTMTPVPTRVSSLPDDFVLPSGLRRFDGPGDGETSPNQGLVFNGVSPEVPARMALIEIDTRFLQLRTEYRLLPIEGEPGRPVVLRHAPSTAERFAVVPGRYRFERTVWIDGQPGAQLDERYQVIRLQRGGAYSFTATTSDEQTLISRIRRQ